MSAFNVTEQSISDVVEQAGMLLEDLRNLENPITRGAALQRIAEVGHYLALARASLVFMP
jgi:hypothetical protein